MKNPIRPLLASLLTLLSMMPASAQSETLSGKLVSLGDAAATLKTGQWYVLYNGTTDAYLKEGSGNTIGVSSASPNETDAASSAGYLVQLEETGTDGKFYIKTGLGNYIANLTSSRNYGTNATLATKYSYTFTALSTAGHYTLRSNNLYYMQNSSGNIIGSSSAGGLGTDRDWFVREVTLSDVGNLTGKALVNYILSQKNLVRITNKRNTTSRLADNGTNTVGASKNDNTLAQVWLLDKSGTGYTLRNAETGRFLDDENNFRTPSSALNKVYIQLSPNNGTNDAYINISEKADFSGNNCLNLGNDGTTLYKWAYQGDAGCDWSIAVVENYNIEEVEEHLLAQSAFSEPVAGKYYRIKNIGYGTYINENFAANTLTCESQDDTKLSQYWTVEAGSGSKLYLRNACTQRYIALQNGTRSTQYRTVANKSGGGFSVNRTSDATNIYFYIMDTSNVGLHCDASSVVVGWGNDNNNSIWGFEVADLDEDFVAEGRAKLDKYKELQSNLPTYKSALANLFQDKACTILNDEIQALSDAELAENADFAALSDDIKAMVLKVKNNTWESFTSNSGYTREGFEKFFRVRDDFYVYSHHSKMSGNAYAGMSNPFGKLSGPTGIVGTTGDIIYIYLDEEPSSDCTLQAEIVMDSDSPGDHQTGNTTNLHAGLNTILIGQPSTLYIFYQLDNPEKYLADYPAAKLHIEGGQLQGYFDYTRGMTNDDWTLLYDKLLDKSKVVNLKSERIVFAMLGSLVKPAMGRTAEAEGLMRYWSQIVDNEEDLMGFKEDLAGRFRNIWNAFSVNHGYMYSTTYGTYYSDGTISTVMNYNTMTTSGGSVWGPAHEIGHNHQACFNIVGATEVSNNLFSNVNVHLLGISTTRGTKVTDTLNDFAAGKGWFGMNIWEQTRFYFQLYLYFHAQGHNPNFYPTLFKLLRQDPIKKRSSTYDATLANEDGVVGGYISYGSQDYLHMAKKMCDAAQLDLSEFFEVNGMFVPYEKFYVGDYADYWVTTTEKDIADAKAYMARYPKAPSICFIDDRIKPSPSIYNGVLEGKPSGPYRVAYDASEAPIGYADVGQWSDFVDEYQTDGYYYTTATSSGTTTYTIFGTGAIGFKMYDNDGNLVFLSNNKKFTLPSKVKAKVADGFKLVACEANGYEVLIPLGTAMYRGEMTVYFEGDTIPHTMHYYGTGTAGKSLMNPLPDNSIAYVKPGQTARRMPTEELLANTNVVGPDSICKTLVIDGDKPFYIPTEFTADSIAFTKSGDGYQTLLLPFDTWHGLGIVGQDGKVDNTPETYLAGQPILVQDAVSITEKGRAVAAGTFAEAESGLIFDGTSFVYAEGISPFTYIFDDPNGIEAVDDGQWSMVNGQWSMANGQVYNLAGQRVSKPSKGIFIVGGKKMLLK